MHKNEEIYLIKEGTLHITLLKVRLLTFEALPGLVKVFPSVSYSTGNTKALPQGANGDINKLLLLK